MKGNTNVIIAAVLSIVIVIIALIAILFVLPSTQKTGKIRASCYSDLDCPPSLYCSNDGICRQRFDSCTRDSDCDMTSERCEFTTGFCVRKATNPFSQGEAEGCTPFTNDKCDSGLGLSCQYDGGISFRCKPVLPQPTTAKTCGGWDLLLCLFVPLQSVK